jgi:uncharacterized membrane protein YdjX (TVP38/TMEM64 family)
VARRATARPDTKLLPSHWSPRLRNGGSAVTRVQPSHQGRQKTLAIRTPQRLIAPIILIALIAAVWVLGLTDRLSWSGLARNQALLHEWVEAHPWLAPCIFVVAYAASVALSLPQATLLTMAGGLLFGTAAGGALAVIGATIGAILLFLIARSAVAGSMAARGGAALAKLREDLQQNGFSYLLAIRLIPVVPFWLINLAAALCGIRLSQFAAATFIGIIPATFVIASIGAGLGGVLARGERPDLRVLVAWPVLGPLLALAMLSLTPVIWRKWRTRHA